MQASSLAHRLTRRFTVKDWADLPAPGRRLRRGHRGRRQSDGLDRQRPREVPIARVLRDDLGSLDAANDV